MADYAVDIDDHLALLRAAERPALVRFAQDTGAPATLSSLPAPAAKKIPHPITQHGETRDDPYAWMRALNWGEVAQDPAKLDPAIRAHIDAENAYARAIMAPTLPLQEQLFQEMKGRVEENEETVPDPDGPFEYLSRAVPGEQYFQHLRRPRGGGKEELILDENVLAKGHAFFSMGGTSVSIDHRLVAYAVDTEGEETYTVRIREISSGRDFPDALMNTNANFAWSADGTALLYAAKDAEFRPRLLYLHRLGMPQSDDKLVYEEMDPGFEVAVGTTQDKAWIVLSASDNQTSEEYLIDPKRPAEPPRLIYRRQAGVVFGVDHHDGEFIVRTNAGGAEDYKIIRAPQAAPEPANWRELVAHEPGRLVFSLMLRKDHLIWLERRDGLDRIKVRRLSDGAEHSVDFAEEAYDITLLNGSEFDTTTIRFEYSSMTTPAETYDYDIVTRQRSLRKRQLLPSGHDPANYVTRRLHATATDGERVPVTLLYRKGLALDGLAPVLLEGYGSYGSSTYPTFDATRLSLADRGLVYALAHVRGGRERGERWYRDGRREKKVNTFTDFLAVARFLVEQKIAGKGRIVAMGASAGGLLMGAVANSAAEEFLGIIADVPFVDVLNTMSDDTLMLTPMEFPEWGNPIASKADFDTIRAYSPYDNVAAHPYPHMLILGGLSDTRVNYWEPLKWAARLRATKTDDRPLLMETAIWAGHFGASGRYTYLRRVAYIWAFALRIAGKGGN